MLDEAYVSRSHARVFEMQFSSYDFAVVKDTIVHHLEARGTPTVGLPVFNRQHVALRRWHKTIRYKVSAVS